MTKSSSHTKIFIAAFGCAILLTAACSNEPFTLLPLGITQVQNVSTSTTAQYKYKNQRLSSYLKWHGGDTTSMKFYYASDGLNRVVIDSTAESYELIRITRKSGIPEFDSLFLITPTAQTLIQARRFFYNSTLQLEGVEVYTPETAGISKTVFALEWNGSNVSTLSKEIIEPGGAISSTTLSLEHDTRMGVYSSDAAYLYTLPMDELYWLSVNNPVRFKRDTLKEVSYKYFYNTFGYPTHIITDKKQTIGHTYVELR